MTPSEGMVIAGRYRLLRPLAKGGMGQLWVAEHIELEVDIAIKFLSAELLEVDKSRQRFKREARAAAQLKSPHVTSTLDYGVFEGSPFIAMELLEGEDLRARLRREGKMSLEQTLGIIEPVCRALELAHQRGLIHRDLKPPNIFIAEVGREELVKVLDFGIAKETREERLVASDGTESGALLGSPRYMSPEQALGDRIDHRTDLWAIGCVAYEMLAGQAAFPSANIAELFSAILHGEVPSVRERSPELPPAIDDFFAAALARTADERFSSAGELAAALRAIAQGDAMPPRDRDRSSITTAADGTRLPPSDTAVDLPPPDATAPPSKDDTAAGVGLDSTAETPMRRRPWLGLVALGVLLVAGGAWWFGRGNAPTPSSAAPSAAAAPEPTRKPAPPPAPATASAPPAPSASASASASSVAPSPRPTPVRPPPPPPPPAAPPPPPPSGGVDPFTGLPL